MQSQHVFYTLEECCSPLWVWISFQHFILELWKWWSIWEFVFFFHMKIFANSPLPLGHLHHLSLSFSSFMLINSPSLISSGCIFRVSCKVTVNIPLFSYSSSSSPILDLNFTFSVIAFYFFLFVGKSFSWLAIFLRCHLSLSLKDNEAMQLCALLSVHELR